MSASTTTAAPAELEAAIHGVSEFPERLGPVLIKELRQGLRSGLFVLPFVILPAVLAIVAVWAFSIDNIATARNSVEGFFWVAVAVPVLLLAPMRALGGIRSEREAQTLDLLQLTPLTAWRIVFAKWSSLVVQGLLWVTALLPFLVLRYFFGGMNLTDELFALLWLVLGGAVLTALCMIISTLPRIMYWITLAVLAFFGLSTGWILFVSFFTRSFLGATSVFWTASVVTPLLTVLMAAHVIFLALTYTASRIAPPADNYAVRLRLGTLLLFVWFAIASWVMTGPDRETRWGVFSFASVALILLVAIEASSPRAPLLTHVRPWARLGPVGLALARLFLPGWPSAVVFFSVALAGAGTTVALQSNETAVAVVVTLLLWPAVLLPRMLQCLFAAGDAERPGLHFVLHLSGLLLAVILVAFQVALRDIVIIPAALFPSALWWLNIFREQNLRDASAVIGVIAAVWVLVQAAVFFWHSRKYWATVAEHGRRARDRSA